MKTKFLSLLVAALLLVSLTPVFAITAGAGIGIDLTTEEFPVQIFMCDDRIVLEDCIEEGRRSDCTEGLFERTQNYLFEGEQVGQRVLVFEKNKIEQVQEVVWTLGDTQGTGNDWEAECQKVWIGEHIDSTCEARILEEKLHEFDPNTMAYYDCLFTAETPESMRGEFFLSVEVISEDSEAITAETEYWFINPTVALTVDGDVEFDDVRPGTVSYSSTILVGNDAEEGSGVLMDMFISGTDFYDPDSSGARCPDTNQLQLSNSVRSPANIVDLGGSDVGTSWPNGHLGLRCEAGGDGLTSDTNADHLCYYATSGAYSTAGAPNADLEGYVPIVYGDTFTRDFYNDAEIINENFDGLGHGSMNLGAFPPSPFPGGLYHNGNVLAPGAEIALNFKLGLPEPCVGDFSEGDIFFWGEAV